jgi:hypothetical protein
MSQLDSQRSICREVQAKGRKCQHLWRCHRQPPGHAMWLGRGPMTRIAPFSECLLRPARIFQEQSENILRTARVSYR